MNHQLFVFWFCHVEIIIFYFTIGTHYIIILLWDVWILISVYFLNLFMPYTNTYRQIRVDRYLMS